MTTALDQHVTTALGLPTPTCQWFALCDRPADGVVQHPILGAVPCCQRCADRFDLTLEDGHTLEGLSDEKLLLLVFASDFAFHYPEEAAEGPWAGTTANYYEVAGAAAETRFGRDHLENISTYAVQWHASIEDLITGMQTDPGSILTILREGVEE